MSVQVRTLDGDKLSLTDPTPLFTMTEYQQHGILSGLLECSGNLGMSCKPVLTA